MEKVTFEVETITPMFLAGNDQFWGEVEDNGDDEPEEAWYIEGELRAPSVRGLLRYWQRALVGGVVPTLDEVQQYEQKLFGATDCGSVVTVRLSSPSKNAQLFMRKNYNRNNIAGSDYLLWSMERSGKVSRRNFKAARYYYPPSTSFDMILSVKGKGAEAQEKLNKAVGTFWLLTQLGGVGSRSRRCAGSLTGQIVDTTYELPKELSVLFEQANNGEALHNQLGKGIEAVRTIYGFNNNPPQPAKQFDVIARNACRIWVFQNSPNAWISSEPYFINGIDYNSTAYLALDDIGKSLSNYRQDKSILERKIFGLPLMPIEKKKRAASPLLLRVAQLKDGSCVGIAVLFKALDEFGNPRDFSLIENWIQDFPHKWEVTL